MRKRIGKQGQSTLEYVIVLTAIVGAIVAAAFLFIKPSMNKIYGDVNTSMSRAGNIFGNSVRGGSS